VTTGLLVTAFTLGLRHGVDWDHLTAIADLAGGQTRRRAAFLLATLYAVGHAAVVLALGLAAVVFGARLPAGLDRVMGRVVGATLVGLAVYLVVTLCRQGSGDRPRRSHWTLLGYGRAAALAVGAAHGVGAETPTQVLVLGSAAGAVGTGAGVVVLVAFLVGLLAANTAVAGAASAGWLHPDRSGWRTVLLLLAAGASLLVGLPLLLNP